MHLCQSEGEHVAAGSAGLEVTLHYHHVSSASSSPGKTRRSRAHPRARPRRNACAISSWAGCSVGCAHCTRVTAPAEVMSSTEFRLRGCGGWKSPREKHRRELSSPL